MLGRRYHNFSSDVIFLVTGLGKVDEVFGVYLKVVELTTELCELHRPTDTIWITRYTFER
jgi:hypothetical protein